MFSIGDFATFTQVSVRALRFYDQQGLLAPARVDPRTGYRSYRADQVAQVLRIVALRDVGLTLAQIREVLDAGASPQVIRERLADRRVEIARLRAQVDHQLAAVEGRLALLDGAPDMHQYDVTTKRAPALVLASIGRTVDQDEPGVLSTAFGELFAELGGALGQAGVVPTGPAWTLYEQAQEEGLRIAAGFPVPATIDLPSGVQRVELSEQTVAVTVHRGSMEGISAAYQAVMTWIESTGRSAAGGAREVSLAWEPEAPDRCVTELQIVLAS
jgi:DNA-binding transcriptional MerR regulator